MSSWSEDVSTAAAACSLAAAGSGAGTGELPAGTSGRAARTDPDEGRVAPLWVELTEYCGLGAALKVEQVI